MKVLILMTVVTVGLLVGCMSESPKLVRPRGNAQPDGSFTPALYELNGRHFIKNLRGDRFIPVE